MITLSEMAELARALLDADKDVERVEGDLKDAKERARVLREETIPAAMQEMGLEEVKLETGQKISIKQDVYASIPAASKGAAYDWLNEHGFGGLIKVEVSATFAKGEQDAALELHKQLLAQGLQPDLDQSVHAQTLKAFLREQIAAGTNVPLDLFGARPVWTAKITNK